VSAEGSRLYHCSEFVARPKWSGDGFTAIGLLAATYKEHGQSCDV
jgi:hypothetical protein